MVKNSLVPTRLLESPILNKGNLAEIKEFFTKSFNLSNRKLTEIEKSVLLVGFKFTPTPDKCNNEELNNDVNERFRRMRLKEFFHDIDIENNYNSMVRNNSNFEAPCGRNISLDSYISAGKAICSNTIGKNNHTKYDLTLKQRKAIKPFPHDNFIIKNETREVTLS